MASVTMTSFHKSTIECRVATSVEQSDRSGNCDIDVDECASSPCTNGAICTESSSLDGIDGSGSWSDVLVEDTEGTNATEDRDWIVPVAEFRCTCAPGYASGVCGYDFISEYELLCSMTVDGICDIDVDECASTTL